MPSRWPFQVSGTVVAAPSGPVTVAVTDGVVGGDERRVGDLGGERDRLARLDAVGRGGELDRIGHAVDQPAQQLAA